MFYLALQILFASAFTLIIKWVQIRKRENIVTVGAINYIAAFLSVIPVILTDDVVGFSTAAIWTGGSMGAVYFVAYFFAIYCIKTVGASSTTVVSVLSILFPITMAAFIWDEIPSGMQTMGIGLALVALLLIGLKDQTERKSPKPWLVPSVLLGFFLLCGCSRLSQETFKHFHQPEQRPTFLLTAFGVAAVPSLILLIYRHRRIELTELGFGVLMGLANVLQSFFILKCLQYYPGYIVFPVVSAGAIVLTTLLATRLLQETLSVRTYAGITVAVFALFMLQ